jgi:hypothetical protein
MNFLKPIYNAVVGSALYLMTALFVFLLMSPVYAQEAIPEPNVDGLMSAINQRHWPLVVAFAVTIVVWIVRYVIKDRIPTKYWPYIVAGTSILFAGATGIIQAVEVNHTWWIGMIRGLLEGATIGLTSLGLWSAGGKKILPTPPKKE